MGNNLRVINYIIIGGDYWMRFVEAEGSLVELIMSFLFVGYDPVLSSRVKQVTT